MTLSAFTRIPLAHMAIAVVLVSSTVTASAWVTWHDDTTRPLDDCAVVAEVARAWRTTGEADSAAADAGTQLDWRRWSEFSEKARHTAESVSAPALEDGLGQFADGTAGFAELYRGSFDVATQTERFVAAGNLVIPAVDALSVACPDAFPWNSAS